MMDLTTLRSDSRTLEHRVWPAWLNEAARLAARFSAECDGDDPFAYNETASVSLLTAAAARVGYLALAEFAETKRHAHDLRRNAPGRSDLWMTGEGRHWAFEFKQITSGAITLGRLAARMDAAIGCAGCVKTHGFLHAFAGLIVTLDSVEQDKREKPRQRLNEFADSRQFAWRIHGEPSEPETYLFFDMVSRP